MTTNENAKLATMIAEYLTDAVLIDVAQCLGLELDTPTSPGGYEVRGTYVVVEMGGKLVTVSIAVDDL